jgi:hypothetical protein
MKIHQISIFIENTPGSLMAPCRVLADAGVNILTLSVSDTRDFGIVHFIVDDWRRAKDVLETEGLVVNSVEVIALEVDDRPGGLADMLAIIDRGNVSVEYMYAFTFGASGKAVLIFRFDDPDRAIDHLRDAGVRCFDTPDLMARCENDA